MSGNSRNNSTRKYNASLLALGEAEMPESFSLNGNRYKFVKLLKHDFFAATGLYCDGDHQVVLKMARKAEFLQLPMEWLGRALCEHETRIYRRLKGLPGIPHYLGRLDNTGFVHEYIPGTEISRKTKLRNDFFFRLYELIRSIHDRDIAYVDFNKRSNIIVSEDGRPYLIDFQISFLRPDGWFGRHGPAMWLFRQLTKADLYHFHKHRQRLKPDMRDDPRWEGPRKRGLLLRAYKFLTHPLKKIRRRTLRRVKRPEEVPPHYHPH